MSAMTLADFEARYRAQPDPWGYASSPYERDKYAATLEACGAGPFRRALELGGSIGVFSALLAARCERLVTIDAAPTAVAAARRRLAERPAVQVLLGAIPDDIPPGSFELVIASEILYYLDRPTLERTLAVLERRLSPGGRLVAVHWRPAGPDRPLSAAEVHEALHAAPWLTARGSGSTDEYLLDVLERQA